MSNRGHPASGFRDTVQDVKFATTGLDSSIELRTEKIHPVVSEIMFFSDGHIHRRPLGKWNWFRTTTGLEDCTGRRARWDQYTPFLTSLKRGYNKHIFIQENAFEHVSFAKCYWQNTSSTPCEAELIRCVSRFTLDSTFYTPCVNKARNPNHILVEWEWVVAKCTPQEHVWSWSQHMYMTQYTQ